MSATNFHDYTHTITTLINHLVASAQAQLLNLQLDQRSMLRGFIAGALLFNDESILYFREFIDLTQSSDPRLMYAYHYQDATKTLIFRYDNAPHKPALTQSNHKHTAQGITLEGPPTFAEVIDEIFDLIRSASV